MHTPESHEPQAAPAHHDAPVDPKKLNKQAAALRTMVIGAVVAVIVLVVATCGVLLYGMYKLGWHNQATSILSHALPLPPAATVNGTDISYAAYADDVATVHHYFATVKADGEPGAPEEPSDVDIRNGVLDRLIQMEILKQEAAHYKVEVTDAEINTEFENFQKSAATEDAADPAAKIQRLYGWTLEQFKEKVMRPYILQQKLSEALAADDALNAEVKAKAEDVLAQIKGGADFAEMAKQHSADPGSAQNGGDLDWFEKGVMVPEFEEVAFAQKAGTVSDLVKTQFGYHIIKTTDVEKDKTGAVVKVKASHILIPFETLDSYLATKTASAKVERLVKVGEAADAKVAE